MTKIKEYLKIYFSTKTKIKIIATLSFTMIFLSVILSTIVTFANQEPINSITITSEKLSYTNKEPGAWKITKSAKWISKGKAQITFTLDTLVKTNNVDNDVILVLDTSGSMSGERLDKLKTDSINLINTILTNKNNSVAVINFSTNSNIITGLTKDKTLLIESINNLEAIGNTNYYQALVNVDNILKEYNWQENKDCVVLFLTDGYPNVNSPNEIVEYNYLKQTYPKLIVNSIQYEMGEEPLNVLKKISDNQYNANTKNLETYLYRASLSPINYENFEIIDYIDTEYFELKNETDITTTTGKFTLENNKITWNLDKINSGSNHTLTIDVIVKNEHLGLEKLLPTNENTSVKSLIKDIGEEVNTTNTPKLKDTYIVSYEGNNPSECKAQNIPTLNKNSVFDIVTITDEEPICEGYKFKEWKIVNNNVKKINKTSFIMPEEDVVIRATWTRLSSHKAMDGKISQVQTLYEMMKDNSVPDNVQSEFVTGEEGIDFTQTSSDKNGKGIYQAVKMEGENTPIYYYRGNIENNNVIFANFCWKIVRTTETKGIKLIYNGIPTEEGYCKSTGNDATIGSSKFNAAYTTLAYNAYMYGETYEKKTKRYDIVGLYEQREYSISNTAQTNYIYSKNVTYDETTGLYTLVDGENKIWNDTYSVDSGNKDLYTCLSNTETSCKIVSYVTRSNDQNAIIYINFENGEIAETLTNKEIIFGNDVTYDETTKTYTLQNITKSKLKDWYNDYTKISGINEPGYHYTCLAETQNCNTVKYLTFITTPSKTAPTDIAYVELSNGVNIETAVKQMTTENTHTKDSTIKTPIDDWYKNNMLIYTQELEDTPWCNDMSISEYGRWEKDGALNKDLLYVTSTNYKNGSPSLKCKNKNNAYTVNDKENGNAALTYPVALLTADEIIYARTNLNIGENWRQLTPNSMSSHGAYNFYVHAGGNLGASYVYNSMGIRPAISLKPGVRSTDGNGTPEEPYIIENKITITVKYDANGGSFGSTNTNEATYRVSNLGQEIIINGKYLEPTHPDENLMFGGWYTSKECADEDEFRVVNAKENNTVYAKWIDKRPSQAIYSKTDNSLTFINDYTDYQIGDAFINESGTELIITNIYKDFESTEYTASTVPWAELKDKVTKIIFQDEINPNSIAYWFDNFKKVTEANVTKLNTNNVKNMKHAFYNMGYDVQNFKIVGLNNWNTSHATIMHNLFEGTGYNSKTWDIGDISNWDTSNVVNMQGLFYKAGYNSNKFTIDVTNWNTSKVTNMNGTFGYSGYKATEWSIGDLTNWDTSKLTDASYMLQNAGYSDQEINIGNINNWNTSNITNMAGIFENYGHSLQTIELNISNWDTSKVTSMSRIFSGIGYSASLINIIGLENLNTTSVTDMSSILANYGRSLQSIELDISRWDTSNVTNMASMFNGIGYSASSINIIGLENLNTTKVTNMSSILANYGRSLQSVELDISRWDTSKVTSMSGMFDGFGYSASSINIIGLDTLNTTNVTNMSNMFANYGYNLPNFELNVGNLKTEKVTTMQRMFLNAGYNSENFKIIGLNNFKTSKVTSIYSMFEATGHNSSTWDIGDISKWNTDSLTNMQGVFWQAAYKTNKFNIDLSKWNTSKVTNMDGTFGNAGYSATEWNIGDLSNWDISSLINMNNLFINAAHTMSEWNVGDISKWNTSSVTIMSNAFNGLGYNIQNFELDISGWDTSNVENMTSMFSNLGYNSESINIIGLKNLNTSKVTNMTNIFANFGYSLQTVELDISKWNTSNVENMTGMFSDIGHNAISINIVGLESLNTSNVTNMTNMFANYGYSVQTLNLDISKWNTSNVVNLTKMFYRTGYNSETILLNLSTLNTSNITNLSQTFQETAFNSQKIEIIGLNTWNTSNVTTINGTFSKIGYFSKECIIGDLSNWNTSKVTNMYDTFVYAGTNATTFNIGNLSNWDTSNVTNMGYMFLSAGKNAEYTLDLSGWDVSKVTNYVAFNGGVESKVIQPIWKY